MGPAARTAAHWASICTIALLLAAAGPALDDVEAAEADDTPAAQAIAAGRAADTAWCQRIHGPQAHADHLPDGQHRCIDAAGRRLGRGSVIVAHRAQR